MSFIIASFRWGYALFQIPGGWLGDRIGPRRALALIVTWWSIFTSATALAWNAVSMTAIRFLFGIGEAGAFPIATRSLSRWMLPGRAGIRAGHHARRLAAGRGDDAFAGGPGDRQIWMAGRLRGVRHAGTGLVRRLVSGIIATRRRNMRRSMPPSSNCCRVRSAERAPGRTHSVPWQKILSSSTLWPLSLMYFCYSYCLAVYLDWFPKYLNDHRGFNLLQMGFYASLPLLAGTGGDLMGGWISDIWAKRSGNLKLARRGVAVFGFLLAAAAILPATLTTSPTASVWYTCVAVFGLELTVGVSWAVPLDIGGRLRRVGFRRDEHVR